MTIQEIEARALKLAELAGGDTTMHITADEHERAGRPSAFVSAYGTVKIVAKPRELGPADLPGKWREMAAESDRQGFVLGRPDAETLRLCARMLEESLRSVGIPTDGGRS